MTGIQIPPEVAEVAKNLGIDLEKLLSTELTPEHAAQLAGLLGTDVAHLLGQQEQAAPAQQPGAAAAAAIAGGVPGAGNIPAQVADGVQQQEGGETETQRLERELAVSQQELQQTRSNIQALQDARVVGSGGLSGPVDNAPPTLAQIEPGIRYAVRNGLIPASTLKEKFGDTIVQLFEADQGGAI